MATIEHAAVTEHRTSTGLPNMKLAMWLFLASDCLLFGALISSYVLYRGASIVGPYPNDVFDIPYTSVSSFVLLASSLTMVLALSAIQRGDQGRFRVWVLATALHLVGRWQRRRETAALSIPGRAAPREGRLP